MADRQLLAATTIYADFAGLVEGEAVTVSLLDPLGTPAVLFDTVAQARGEGRYTFDVPALTFSMSGIWTAIWTAVSGASIVQEFSVGVQPLAGLTKWDMRIQLARRVESVVMGRVSYAVVNSISDNLLAGGADEYQFWYLMLPSQPDAGRVFRVTSWNGSALELSDNFIEIPKRGQQYALFNIDPLELDQAMNAAIAEIAPMTRIEEQIGPMPAVLGEVALPKGINYVSEVFSDTTDAEVSRSTWDLRTRRRLVVPTTNLAVHVRGLRDAVMPTWEDSIVETAVSTTIARAAITLHSSRASGPALDMEEHLRRQVAAQDDYERSLRRTAGRMPAGVREVMV
jgi:hypothetical protein